MNLFSELSIIIVAAAVVSGLMRILKQPLVIGYVLTGVFLGPYFLGVLNSTEEMSVFSQMGVAILLFIVGLNLNPREFRSLGAHPLLIGLLQILTTAFFGFLISRLFGFSVIECIYIGTALSFSSTIVVLKFLADKKDLEKLYGRISIAVLLLQDIAAAIALIVISGFSGGSQSAESFLLLVVKGLALLLVISLATHYLMPSLGAFFARSSEFLFIFSLAWGFGLAALSGVLGFSLEIGALIAGVSLSMLPYSSEISSRLKPLRDFFVVMFFIFLGYQISFEDISSIFLPLLVLCAFVLLIKPLLVCYITEIFGYSPKTSFMTGISLAQISEFSMIFILLGMKVGHVSNQVVNMITIIGFLSIAVSSYLINYSEKLYPIFLPLMRLFENRTPAIEKDSQHFYDTVLFGCNRAGYDFLKVFRELGSHFLAVDFDPDIIKELGSKGINCMYGDAEDAEFLEEINIGKSKIVISTIPEFETNSFLLSRVRSENKDSLVLLLSYNIDEAIKLYEDGATYVILPHFIGGEYAVKLAGEAGFDVAKLNVKREEHVRYLKERKELGHAHPTWVHNQ